MPASNVSVEPDSKKKKKKLLIQPLKQVTISISPTIRLDQIQITHTQDLWSEVGGNLIWFKKKKGHILKSDYKSFIVEII